MPSAISTSQSPPTAGLPRHVQVSCPGDRFFPHGTLSRKNPVTIKGISSLHPYDGVDHRFRHTDPDPAPGLAAVAKLLRLPEPLPPEGLFYDVSFYSGGIGILDRLALSLPATAALWTRVITALNGRTPEAAAAIPAWSEDFLWLLTLDGDAELPPPREAAVQFINSERQPFQPECSPASHIYFQYDSNVNDWVALWGDDSRLNYLGYGQG